MDGLQIRTLDFARTGFRAYPGSTWGAVARDDSGNGMKIYVFPRITRHVGPLPPYCVCRIDCVMVTDIRPRGYSDES